METEAEDTMSLEYVHSREKFHLLQTPWDQPIPVPGSALDHLEFHDKILNNCSRQPNELGKKATA